MTTEATGSDALSGPTLVGVAELAGVSRSTASRVINGSPNVTEETVARVNEAIARLGYVPNRAARSLVRRRTQTIAMVIPERTAEFFADPYFAEVIQGAAMYASSTDYSLTLLIESESDPAKAHRFLRRGNVDGALVLSHYSASSDYLELSRSLPVVFGVRPAGGIDAEIHIVDVDNDSAAALATEHLIETGRTRIATISGPQSTSAGRERQRGWHRALADAGLGEAGCEEGDYTPASGAAAMERLLAGAGGFDAVFAASAQMAAGALEVLSSRGIRVPEDVAVATIDNNVFTTTTTPPLTTVDLHTAGKGATMVATLERLIRGEHVEAMTPVPIELVRRGSS
ncbi:LacI family transcriptional regulator [Herbiconiux sp. CPCC 203407]|uniref:LacI family transcriptional regulator n=1 Tax=Herbiconiux oxytropis TaxID=2970915 RepID=A0AA41XE91_9MICO|nr:LacI family DNA-binding transcriptional regulator [Herbiconiux oxytropis]MCS5721558.1 LacI family transcriptional regulator [Herbiconiux oxytropis]MCS5724635.1 LacI family transcriptional regulator [Herbiconiux oxytropis]